jgi:hypothetical protein
VARKRTSISRHRKLRPYPPAQLAEFRRQIKEAVNWAKANKLDVLPNCWSLGTVFGVKSCAQMGFCCPLGAVLLRTNPKHLNPQKWSCLASAAVLGATEDFVAGFIAGYEGHVVELGLTAHHSQGYRMGAQFRKTQHHPSKGRVPKPA